MTYSTARYISGLGAERVAMEMAKRCVLFDPKGKKIMDQIDEHQAAIRKLEQKLGEMNVKKGKELLPKAERRIEEAKKIVELYEQMEVEFNKKLLANRAL